MSGAIYAIYYTGIAGSGLGLFTLKDEIICGVDATGGNIDGTYTTGPDGTIHTKVRLTIPAGVTLVTGGIPMAAASSLEFPVDLKPGFDNSEPVQVAMPTGPVNVVFRKLRDLVP